jgi:putative flippase GtrA
MARDVWEGFLETFCRYLVSGGAAVAVHLALLFALVEHLGADETLATSVGFFLGSVVNYLLQYHVVFKSRSRHLNAFVRYGAVTLIMLGVNAIVFRLLTDGFGMWYMLAQATATGMVFVLNFLVNRSFTFAGGSRA